MIVRTASIGGLVLALLVCGIAAAVFWIEAGKEIRILCGLFGPGARRSEVERTLATGDFLRARTRASEVDPQAVEIAVDSPWNLRTVRCTVRLREGRVISAALEGA